MIKGTVVYKCKRCRAEFRKAAKDIFLTMADQQRIFHECSFFEIGVADVVGADYDSQEKLDQEEIRKFWAD